MNRTSEERLRADQRPLYAQASEALRALVQRGGYAAGQRLPSEIELSQRLGISRPTLREALHQLEEEGLIYRRHGVGTFVAEPATVIDAGLELLESIDRMAERRGMQTRMSAASIAERPASARETAGLGLSYGRDVTVVQRVIVADGRHVAHLTDVVPCAYLRREELGEAFQGSVLDHLLARGWPALSHSRTELSAEAADAELARALHITRSAPLLKLEAQLFAQDGNVVDYSISYFVPGHFNFHVVRRVAEM